mgnify:CR=1 FL=1
MAVISVDSFFPLFKSNVSNQWINLVFDPLDWIKMNTQVGGRICSAYPNLFEGKSYLAMLDKQPKV